jgi:hypothetical protein
MIRLHLTGILLYINGAALIALCGTNQYFFFDAHGHAHKNLYKIGPFVKTEKDVKCGHHEVACKAITKPDACAIKLFMVYQK